MPNPKVSILVAAYNAESTIDRCIVSCLKQSYQNFEVIIIDDGSTDKTAEMLKSYQSSDGRVRPITVENGGQGKARNIALEYAEGDYVTVLDADDALHIRALELLVASAQQEASQIVVGEWITIDERKRQKRYAPVFGGVNLAGNVSAIQSKIIGNTYFSVAKLYDRKFILHNDISYSEGHIYEDMQFLIGAVLLADRISIVPEPLYFVYAGDDSSTKTLTDSDWHAVSFSKAVRSTINKYREQMLPFRKEYGYYILGRVYLYTVTTNRIPRRIWKSFSNEIISCINLLHTTAPTRHTASGRYFVPLRVWRSNKYLGYLLFRIVGSDLALRTAVKTLRIFKKVKRYPAKTRLVGAVLKKIRAHKKRNILKLAKSEPMDDNAVLMHGFDGQVKGNTKYAIPALLDEGFSVVIPSSVPVTPSHPNLKVVKPWSPEHHYWFHKARFHLLETWRHPGIGKRDTAIWIQMWHGTPFKRMLFDSPETDVVARAPAHKPNKMRDICGWDYLLAQNTFSIDALSSSFKFGAQNILDFGYPRTDVLKSNKANEIVEKIRKKYRVADDKKILLYATTWRDYNQYTERKDFSYQLDLEKIAPLLEDYVVLCCLHPFGKDSLSSDAIITEGDDFQHLLLAADGLVTDYSSAAFDFLLLNRPFCFLTKDLQKFERSRGVYGEILDDFSDFVAMDEGEVVSVIQNWPGLDAIKNRDRYIMDPQIASGEALSLFMKKLQKSLME